MTLGIREGEARQIWNSLVVVACIVCILDLLVFNVILRSLVYSLEMASNAKQLAVG